MNLSVLRSIIIAVFIVCLMFVMFLDPASFLPKSSNSYASAGARTVQTQAATGKGVTRARHAFKTTRVYKTSKNSTTSKTSTTSKNSTTSKTSTTSKNSKRKKVKKITRIKLLRAITHASKSAGLKAVGGCSNCLKTKAGKHLSSYLKKLRSRYKVSFFMLDLKSAQGISAQSARYMYSASSIKGPYVVSLNKYKAYARKQSWSLMRSAIIFSSNDAYASLRRRYGSSSMSSLMSYCKVEHVSAHKWYTWLPARKLAKLWVGAYWYFYKEQNKNSRKCRAIYTHGTNSFIHQTMRGKFRVYTKPGWYPSGRYKAQNDAGIVMAKRRGAYHPYVLSIMTNAYGQYSKLRHLVRLINAVHVEMVKAQN